tara:strand:- start:1213 stop:1548 length:336 start_codon:yes stop_codon:yes gene_type:complete
MATTYSWKINALDTYPTKDSLADVVYNVHYSYIATSDQKDSNGNPYSTDFIGAVQIGDPDSKNFTAFADLKESTVIGWIESVLDVTTMKSSIDTALADIITPPTVTKKVPW